MMIIIIATKYYNSGPLATHRALGGGRAVRFSHVNLTGRASPLGTRKRESAAATAAGRERCRVYSSTT
jgi:hypothetical protein